MVELSPTLPLLLEAELPSAPALGANEPFFRPHGDDHEKVSQLPGSKVKGVKKKQDRLARLCDYERTREQPVRGVGGGNRKGIDNTIPHAHQVLAMGGTGGEINRQTRFVGTAPPVAATGCCSV